MNNPKISVVVPIHATMKNGDFFLWRLVQSLMEQTYKNYELVVTQEGTMPENTNAGMRKATGDLIKILYMDDYFAHENALKEIVEHFPEDAHWLATGCLHQNGWEVAHSPHLPVYTEDIHTGNNQIGSPSVITIRNKGALFFDENLSWLLDADLYRRYYETYGPPILLNDLNVIIGLGEHQMTHQLSNERKLSEHSYLMKKYE